MTCQRQCRLSMNVYVFKDVRVGVYTARARSARGLIFFDDGDEGMSIERRKDAGCEDAGLLEERGQRGAVEGVQQSIPDSLSESPQVVQDDLGLWTEFILIRSLEMLAIEHREIGIGVENREDQAPLRMEDAVQLPNCDQWRGDERE